MNITNAAIAAHTTVSLGMLLAFARNDSTMGFIPAFGTVNIAAWGFGTLALVNAGPTVDKTTIGTGIDAISNVARFGIVAALIYRSS